ncbi:MAG: DNA-binding protein [Planctomycetota bacterium]|nr:MAG: DNA-binding protein [Planctomycetota bacterium]
MTLSEPAVDGVSSPTRLAKRKKTAGRVPRLHVRVDEAAEMSGVSLATWWRWDASGAIPQAVKIGGVKLWSVRSLKLWSRWGCPNRRELVERLAAFEADAVRRGSRKGGR